MKKILHTLAAIAAASLIGLGLGVIDSHAARPTPTLSAAPVAEAMPAPEPSGEPVPANLAEFLAEEPGQADRDWALCTLYVGDTSYVVCPDGYVASS